MVQKMVPSSTKAPGVTPVSGRTPRTNAIWTGSTAADRSSPAGNIHRFSTLITAQQVRDLLGTEEGIAAAIDWCRKTAVTKVYVESFRSTYLAPRETLRRARERFQAAGFEAARACFSPAITMAQAPSEVGQVSR